ncbi:peptidyl-prolyl cis-trans isomerase FKBP62 isoform X1 [Vigna angularis]|uniref:peptidyl-prolyl cis-trans isomerase FKBP62 isoform X1 n=1 Tax=Phaseolus angularis TaxID=3914 RepID=UPI000809DE7F|nr:peptidyl-prolyl cis-trans isomerase FKBP62 isoform X1 [Vigna angularis]
MVVLSSEDDFDEEPGEVIESAPPQKVGEERQLRGLKKKLLRHGHGWETPNFNDVVTVHRVGTLLDGAALGSSTWDTDQPLTFTLGNDDVPGLDRGITSMKKGEVALFTLPADDEGDVWRDSDSVVQFEVELLSWIRVVDVCKDGGVIKKIVEQGSGNDRPSDLDEVLVKYQVALVDGTVVEETPEGGVEFYVKDGHLFPILPKVIMTMTRGEKAELIVQPQYAFGETGRDSGTGLCRIPPNSVLHANIELVSFKPVINVTGDSKVLKKILKEGEGAFTANEDAHVTVSFTAMLEDGTVFEKRRTGEEQPLEFITDEEQVIVGLDRAVATMKKGERAIISIHPEYAFGNVEVKRDLAIVPPGSNVVYDVEMLDFIKEKAPWELNSKEKIEVAGRKKEEGNVLFIGGNYLRAQKKYEQAVDFLSDDGSFGYSEQKQADALRVSCWLNSATCSLKLNDFSGAIKLCSQVLDVEFCNVKALYRRAQAYIETGDFVLADVDIKKALVADPQNREVKIIQKKLKQLQADKDKKDAKLYENMFACKTKDSSTAIKRLKVEKDERENEDGARMEEDTVADSAVI